MEKGERGHEHIVLLILVIAFAVTLSLINQQFGYSETPTGKGVSPQISQISQGWAEKYSDDPRGQYGRRYTETGKVAFKLSNGYAYITTRRGRVIGVPPQHENLPLNAKVIIKYTTEYDGRNEKVTLIRARRWT